MACTHQTCKRGEYLSFVLVLSIVVLLGVDHFLHGDSAQSIFSFPVRYAKTAIPFSVKAIGWSSALFMALLIANRAATTVFHRRHR